MENRNKHLISQPRPIIPLQTPSSPNPHAHFGWGTAKLTSYEHSKEEWESLKPVIHDLYIEQNTKQKDLVPMLKARYDFKISPKQLTSRLKAWGFAKKSKRTTRTHYNGRKVSNENLNSLKKKRTMWNDYHNPDPSIEAPKINLPRIKAPYANTPELNAVEFDATGEQPDGNTDFELGQPTLPFSWNRLDVQNSPRLTRLFLHLEVGSEEEISDFKLPPPSVPLPMPSEYVSGSEANDKSSAKKVFHEFDTLEAKNTLSFASYASSSQNGREPGWQVINSDFDSPLPKYFSPCSSPSPFNEVHVFPTPVVAKFQEPKCIATWEYVKEYASKLSHLQRIGKLSLSDLRNVEIIRKLVVLCRSLGTFRAYCEAEYWCQELSKRNYELDENSVVRLMDELNFVVVVFKQKRLQKALAMIESIGNDLERNGIPNDQVLIYFSSLKGGILGQLRDYENQEKLYRDCLQQCLNTLGASHNETLKSMYRLSFPLRITGRIQQSEELLRIAIHLGNKNSITLYNVMPTLGRVMYEQGQHREAISLGRQALEKLCDNLEGEFGSVQEDIRLSIRCIVESYLREDKIRESIEAVREYSDLGEKFVLIHHYLFLLGEVAEACQNNYEVKMLLSLLEIFDKKKSLDTAVEESRKNIQILRDNSGNPDDLGYELWYVNYLEKWYRKQKEAEEDEAAGCVREFVILEE